MNKCDLPPPTTSQYQCVESLSFSPFSTEVEYVIRLKDILSIYGTKDIAFLTLGNLANIHYSIDVVTSPLCIESVLELCSEKVRPAIIFCLV